MLHRKLPKPKKGAWYVRVAGSYLPVTWQGWALHLVMVVTGIGLLLIAWDDPRPLIVVITLTFLELVGLGALFTWVAKQTS